MPGIITALTDAVKNQKNSGGNSGQSMIDKVTSKPTAFDEKEDKFPGLRRRFENFVARSYGEDFREVLTWTTETEAPITALMWDVEFQLLRQCVEEGKMYVHDVQRNMLKDIEGRYERNGVMF